jgi:bleomycin hydrolase
MLMKQVKLVSLFFVLFHLNLQAQDKKGKAGNESLSGNVDLSEVVSPVKNQGQTGTCWAFSGVAMIESDHLGFGKDPVALDLSEMYIARRVYLKKAHNYILRQGKAQFSEGALGHDLINAIHEYGVLPEVAYSGKLSENHDHASLFKELKDFLDSLIAKGSPLQENWQARMEKILDAHLGKVPDEFMFNGTMFNPQSFGKQFRGFRSPNDFAYLTSFTHHPYYASFVLEVPDNFSNGSYYNLPLKELKEVVLESLKKGFTVLWDADVSNPGFNAAKGYALLDEPRESLDAALTLPGEMEVIRQKRFESLVTQDDHLMQIIGVETLPSGKLLFRVKNSWGEVGPLRGFIKVSEAYFLMNTINVIIKKDALGDKLRKQLR